jgi:hypothetical protein
MGDEPKVRAVVPERDVTTGAYCAEWCGAKGWVSGAVYVAAPCPAHRERAYCVRLGAVCYPPRDFQLTGRMGERS